MKISSYTNVTGEENLKLALFNKGAVAVNIDASHKSLSFYESGVYFEEACSEFLCYNCIILLISSQVL